MSRSVVFCNKITNYTVQQFRWVLVNMAACNVTKQGIINGSYPVTKILSRLRAEAAAVARMIKTSCNGHNIPTNAGLLSSMMRH